MNTIGLSKFRRMTEEEALETGVALDTVEVDSLDILDDLHGSERRTWEEWFSLWNKVQSLCN